jgi:hypothetical protein
MIRMQKALLLAALSATACAPAEAPVMSTTPPPPSTAPAPVVNDAATREARARALMMC